MKKFIALLLTLVFAFALAACGSDEANPANAATTVEETTTEVPASEVPSEPLTSDVTAADGQSTVADSTTLDGATTAAGETTAEATTKVAIVAPLGSDKNKVVNFYNNVANATKGYAGTMKVDRTQGTKSKLNTVSVEFARGTVEGVLPNDYPQNSTKTFTNGKTKSGESIKGFLPIEGDARMSTLQPSGVASAACTESDGGYKIVIKLAEEVGHNLFYKAPNHASCMATLGITEEDLKPLKLKEATISYTGATITAFVNADGLLTSMELKEPVVIDGTLSLVGIPIIEVNVTGTWQQEFKFTY